ncbi:hypothetical protein ACFVUN_32360 [Kitasatospora griseola]|uniref:hypothetical protein n=1 Tax=Kitasatospora griseola TaxID=2064 RepID=UPI0036D89F5A
MIMPPTADTRCPGTVLRRATEPPKTRLAGLLGSRTDQHEPAREAGAGAELKLDWSTDPAALALRDAPVRRLREEVKPGPNHPKIGTLPLHITAHTDTVAQLDRQGLDTVRHDPESGQVQAISRE